MNAPYPPRRPIDTPERIAAARELIATCTFTEAGNPVSLTPADWEEADRCLADLAGKVDASWLTTHREKARKQFAIAAMQTRKHAERALAEQQQRRAA